jgi:tagaturonate reductase
MQLTELKKLNRHNFETTVYPERVIQFGTGVLLRGLVDYAIDKANKQGVFKGSVVQIKSTGNGSADEFAKQDNLYTIALRGMEHGALMQRYELNSCISRTLNANSEWTGVLQLAHQEAINIIVSNTTEAGIVFDGDDSITKTPPATFPAKLLALLNERYVAFAGDMAKGYIIVPTELISNNGNELRAIVLKLAQKLKPDADFIHWIEQANTFCNSLVDRIVTGTPTAEKLKEHWQQLDYQDKLLIECEPYLLWAIQGNEQIKQQLGFALPDNGVMVASSIEKFKELKLRLLNGTHTFICGMAYINGFEYVKDAVQEPVMLDKMRNLLMQEIAPSLPYNSDETIAFAQSVLERFENPFIEHKWINITLNYTQKMASRNIASILRYYEKMQQVPQHMAMGFAYYIRFMTVFQQDENQVFYGKVMDKVYPINDPEAGTFYQLQQQYQDIALVKAVLAKTDWWQTDLNKLPGFAAAVSRVYETITN